MEVTSQEIQAAQGTRLSDRPQWETYSEEMATKVSPELQEQIKRYEERVHERNKVAEEELARQKELSDEAARQYQWLTPEEYEKLEPRVGHIIHSSVFLNTLRAECGVNCWYAEHPLPKRLKLIVDRQNGINPEMACWVQEGFQVEYSWMNFDDHGVPLDERRRGWRTCLLQLILQGVLTEEKANEVFGEATGPASVKYNSLLYGLRNKKVKLKEE